MELSDWVKVFDRLLPRSPAWSLVHESNLKRFFHGLSVASKTTRDYLASILLEVMPQYTSHLHEWSQQLGSPEDFTADELEAILAADRGQSPQHMQDALRTICSSVYVHEWFEPGSSPPSARSPMSWAPGPYVLVNDINYVQPNWIYQFKADTSPTQHQFKADTSPTQCQFGAYDGYRLQRKVYPCPDEPYEYPVYWYVCGEVFGDAAYVPEGSLEKLIKMIFRVKPVHTRVVLIFSTLPSGYDYIQDVVRITDPVYQDTISLVEDGLQDE